MRFVAAFAGHLSVLCAFSTSAFAQLVPPPPMQSGGLAPPPPGSGPPPPPQPQPSPTQMRLEESGERDSGRGLEFVYFAIDGGFEFAGLNSLHESGALLPGVEKSSSFGPLVGVGSGVRLLYFTLGPHFRFAHFSDWDLWTLNLDLGWHIPLGRLEPYAILGGGYAKLGHAADDLLGADRGVSISGFNVRLGGGVDYYLTNVFSLGAMLDVELLRLSRSGVTVNPTDNPAASVFKDDASSLGLTVTAGAVVGFHF